MKLITLDAETYYDSDYSLKNMSTTDYIFDPRFELIGMGVRVDGGPRAWLEEAQWHRFAGGMDWSQTAVLAHHNHFDGLICSHHYDVHPGYMLDTLSMARALHGAEVGGSLAKLMLYYGVGEKGTEVIAAKGKHRKDFTQAEWKQYGVYCLNDCDGAFAIFQKMLVGYPRKELDLIDITVKMFSSPVLVLNTPKMQEYLAWETAKKLDLLNRISATKADLSSSDKFAKLLEALGVEPPLKPSPTAVNDDGSPKEIYAFAKTDPAFQELLQDPDDDVRWLCEARLATKSTGAVTRTTRLLRMGLGGRALPVYLNYGKAGTFRWTGGDKMNWQNFERMDKNDPRKGSIRQAIEAPSGSLLVGGDASQIECRFNNWFSGQDDITEAFRQGADVYSLFGSKVYGRKLDRKKNPEDETPGFISKTCVLALGFNTGFIKLGGALLRGEKGPPVQFTREDMSKLNVDPTQFFANPKNIEQIMAQPSRLNDADKLVHYAVANHFVEMYRRDSDKVVANWGYWNEVIGMMMRGYRGVIGPFDILEIVEDGIRLPSGLTMWYRDLRWDKKEGYSYRSKRGERTKIYGGKLVENYTQALCRIIVADVMRQLDKEGLHIVTMEHDAIIGVCPERDAPYWDQRLLALLSTPPSWAPGLPLTADHGFGRTLGETK